MLLFTAFRNGGGGRWGWRGEVEGEVGEKEVGGDLHPRPLPTPTVGRWRVEVGGWEVRGGRVGGWRWEGYGNGQVRFDRFDRRSDSMPVFAVGWLGMLNPKTLKPQS